MKTCLVTSSFCFFNGQRAQLQSFGGLTWLLTSSECSRAADSCAINLANCASSCFNSCVQFSPRGSLWRAMVVSSLDRLKSEILRPPSDSKAARTCSYSLVESLTVIRRSRLSASFKMDSSRHRCLVCTIWARCGEVSKRARNHTRIDFCRDRSLDQADR